MPGASGFWRSLKYARMARNIGAGIITRYAPARRIRHQPPQIIPMLRRISFRRLQFEPESHRGLGVPDKAGDAYCAAR